MLCGLWAVLAQSMCDVGGEATWARRKEVELQRGCEIDFWEGLGDEAVRCELANRHGACSTCIVATTGSHRHSSPSQSNASVFLCHTLSSAKCVFSTTASSVAEDRYQTLLPQVSRTLSVAVHHPLPEHSILLSQDFWLVMSMFIIVPLSFLRTLDSLRFTSQIALGTVV